MHFKWRRHSSWSFIIRGFGVENRSKKNSIDSRFMIIIIIIIVIMTGWESEHEREHRANSSLIIYSIILWGERGRDRWRKRGSRNWSWAAILKAVTRRGYMVCHAIRMNPKRTRCRVTSRRYEMRLPFFIRFGMNLHLVGWIGFEPIKERYGHGIAVPHSCLW